eukprot:3186726-Prymnesium_polylepis.1
MTAACPLLNMCAVCSDAWHDQPPARAARDPLHFVAPKHFLEVLATSQATNWQSDLFVFALRAVKRCRHCRQTSHVAHSPTRSDLCRTTIRDTAVAYGLWCAARLYPALRALCVSAVPVVLGGSAETP